MRCVQERFIVTGSKKSTKGSPTKIVCECLGVTEADLIQAIRKHELESVKDIAHYTEAGKGCTACHSTLREYLTHKPHLADGSPICSLK